MTRVAVYGAASLPSEVASVVDVVAVSPVEAGGGDSSEPDAALVVAVGEESLSAAAARGESRPILPVGLDADWSPGFDSLADLFSGLADGEPPTVAVEPLVVSADGSTSTAVFDTTLVTSEPARISEYAVSANGRPHAEFRADGVVVATPLGSYGYARAAGGPQLALGAGLAVVPIAPFATRADTWVLSPPLSVRVERDDAVTAFADTARLAEGRSGLTVEIETGEPLSVVDPRHL